MAVADAMEYCTNPCGYTHTHTHLPQERGEGRIGSSRWPLFLTTTSSFAPQCHSQKENTHTHTKSVKTPLCQGEESSLPHGEAFLSDTLWGTAYTINYRDKHTPANYTFTRPLHGHPYPTSYCEPSEFVNVLKGYRGP